MVNVMKAIVILVNHSSVVNPKVKEVHVIFLVANNVLIGVLLQNQKTSDVKDVNQ